ncbi:Hypothetical predicted protein [Pelobates cultripes]|uniref:Uncharacterized protein n=1 Tax=Pelobates cultripes TaxID=61616 RepID=A0AAD1TI43_PELCU|nr:Hypothetical predicted protein [Pelobates cultripes]
MATQPRSTKRSTCSKAHMFPMAVFDQLCEDLRKALLSQRAAHLTVALWMRPAARCKYYKQVTRASKMAVRQSRYQRALRNTPSHPHTSNKGTLNKRSTLLQRLTSNPATDAAPSTSPRPTLQQERLQSYTS